MLIVLLFCSQQVLMTTTQEVNEVSIMQLFQQPTEFHIIDKGEALEPEKAFLIDAISCKRKSSVLCCSAP
jgi:hypothetical protein